MFLKVCALASGSKGNCYYVGDENNHILVDCGISYSETKNRLSEIGVDIKDITAILNTHSHGDHIKGIDYILKNCDAQLFSHFKNSSHLSNKLQNLNNVNWVNVDGEFYLGDILVTPVEVSHDVPCVSYVFTKKNKKVSILTDLGHTNSKIIQQILGSDILYIEANYDESMLLNGVYPLRLKRRIHSTIGHLSNEQCAETCAKVIDESTQRIILSHLSENNNTPQLAYNNVVSYLNSHKITFGCNFKIEVAHQNKIGTMFKIV